MVYTYTQIENYTLTGQETIHAKILGIVQACSKQGRDARSLGWRCVVPVYEYGESDGELGWNGFGCRISNPRHWRILRVRPHIPSPRLHILSPPMAAS